MEFCNTAVPKFLLELFPWNCSMVHCEVEAKQQRRVTLTGGYDVAHGCLIVSNVLVHQRRGQVRIEAVKEIAPAHTCDNGHKALCPLSVAVINQRAPS